MIKSSKRLIVGASLLILVSLACNVPILDQIQTVLAPTDDTGSSLAPADDTGLTSSTEGTSTDSTAPANTDGAEITYIPGATFQMGSAPTDLLADEDEFPQHDVTVDEFHIYTYEVTNQMYGACIDAGYCLSPYILEDGPTSHFEDPDFEDFPVVGVDWVMARDYCGWAGGRLPTEAEWELASRGPDSLLYPWGEEEPTCDYVNMGGCLIPPDTQKIGHYLMGNSPDGVWDLSGNVWEWVHDWYADDYYAQSPADNPVGPLEPQDPDKPLRVIRGGGLYSEPDKIRSASRLGLNPYRVFTDVGFRCVVGEGLSLPAAYDHGHDRHERVPPDSADGGDSADDTDGDSIARWAEDIHGPCPDGSGTLTLTIPTGSDSPITEVFALYEADAWDASCAYDPVAEIATCEGPEPIDYMTNPPPVFALDICISDDEDTVCSPIHVTKPTDCDSDDGGPRDLLLRPDCLEIDGVMTPVVIIQFFGIEAVFEGASANDTPLICEADGEDIYICRGLPGSAGEELEVTSTFDGISPMTVDTEFPSCGGPLEFGDPFALAQVGCQGESEYYAVIDTFITDEIATWSLEGVEGPLDCGPADPPRPGRFYCNFAIRNWYTTLTFCVEIVGRPGEICETFAEEEFGAMLPARCSDPDDDDDPGDNGGGDDEMGFCVPIINGCGPCLPDCPPGENCMPCTLP